MNKDLAPQSNSIAEAIGAASGSGPAVFVNHAHVNLINGGIRIGFVEVVTTGPENVNISLRSAVFLTLENAMEIHEAMGKAIAHAHSSTPRHLSS